MNYKDFTATLDTFEAALLLEVMPLRAMHHDLLPSRYYELEGSLDLVRRVKLGLPSEDADELTIYRTMACAMARDFDKSELNCEASYRGRSVAARALMRKASTS